MSTLYTYNKQQFNADVSLNGTNTVTGKTQFTSDVSLNGHITTTVDGKRFTSTSNSRFTSADTFTTFINNDKTSGDVRINTGSSGSNVIVENGNVGIGTASPQRTLTVNGLINSREIRLVDINQDISDNTTHMDVGTNLDGHYLWGYGATKPLFFGTNQSEKMRISASGNVGIGTTNPQYTLDVSGNANVSGSFNSLMYITTKIFDFNSSHVSNSQSTSKFIGKIFNGGLITVYIKSSGYDHGEGTIAEIFCGFGTQPVVRVVSGFISTYSFYSILVNGTTYIWFNEYYHSGGESVNYECRIYCNNPSNFYPTTTDGNAPSGATEITKGQFILGNGNVGIGKTNPMYTLDVSGTVNCGLINTTSTSFNQTYNGTTYFSKDYIGFGTGDGFNSFNVSIRCYGIHAAEIIFAKYLAAHSDSRIKNNIIDIDDSKALSILRQIQPKTYEYVDKYKRGNESVIGFIAQEIKAILPKAVTISIDYIPNFYTNCQVAATDVSNIVLVTSPIDLSWNPLHDQSGNAFIDAAGNACSDASGNKCFNVKLYDQSNNEIKCKTTNVLDKRSFLMDISGSKMLNGSGNILLEKDGGYFLYGQEVDDFHNIDKASIFTVVTAAVQDIDRKQVLDEAKIVALEAQVASQDARIAALEQAIAALLAK